MSHTERKEGKINIDTLSPAEKKALSLERKAASLEPDVEDSTEYFAAETDLVELYRIIKIKFDEYLQAQPIFGDYVTYLKEVKGIKIADLSTVTTAEIANEALSTLVGIFPNFVMRISCEDRGYYWTPEHKRNRRKSVIGSLSDGGLLPAHREALGLCDFLIRHTFDRGIKYFSSIAAVKYTHNLSAVEPSQEVGAYHFFHILILFPDYFYGHFRYLWEMLQRDSRFTELPCGELYIYDFSPPSENSFERNNWLATYPLQLAVLRDKTLVVHLLLEHGARIDQCISRGKTNFSDKDEEPVVLAFTECRLSTLEYFVSHEVTRFHWLIFFVVLRDLMAEDIAREDKERVFICFNTMLHRSENSIIKSACQTALLNLEEWLTQRSAHVNPTSWEYQACCRILLIFLRHETIFNQTHIQQLSNSGYGDIYRAARALYIEELSPAQRERLFLAIHKTPLESKDAKDLAAERRLSSVASSSSRCDLRQSFFPKRELKKEVVPTLAMLKNVALLAGLSAPQTQLVISMTYPDASIIDAALVQGGGIKLFEDDAFLLHRLIQHNFPYPSFKALFKSLQERYGPGAVSDMINTEDDRGKKPIDYAGPGTDGHIIDLLEIYGAPVALTPTR